MAEQHPAQCDPSLGYDLSLGYDELPYPSAPYPYSHCDHLAMVARLFGIAAADVRRCRVLEVGCADGANLIPMALTLPESRFVGIDLSARQISAGRGVIEQLALANIELRQQDLSEFVAEGQTFDYIVAHGVFSWTSREVQSRLLDLCRACLAENGVAFVSYNVYPGWQQQKVIREWLLRALRTTEGAAARVQAARRMIGSLRSLLATRGDASQRAIADTLQRLEGWSDGYLRHDLLEDSNAPQFFADFVDRVAAHGLRFFAEADVASMVGSGLPIGLAEGVARLSGSLVGREQLFDVLTNRAFRQSLLCRSECFSQERLDENAIRSAYVISTLRARTGKDAAATDAVRFESRGQFTIDVAEPLAAAALARLQNAYPGGAWFGDLIPVDAATRVEDAEAQRQSLARVLLAAFVDRAVELHTVAPPAALVVAERPVASPLARLQVEHGNLVTNLRHDVVLLDEQARTMIRFLDGTRDRAALERVASTATTPAAAVMNVDELMSFYLRSALLQP